MVKRNIKDLEWEVYKPHKNVFIKKVFENNVLTQIYAKIKPGAFTMEHFYSGSELFFILKGQGEMVLNKKKIVKLSRGDSIYVPKKTFHKVINKGKNDLLILSTFSPSFKKQKHNFGR